jgi:hypothetical protein
MQLSQREDIYIVIVVHVYLRRIQTTQVLPVVVVIKLLTAQIIDQSVTLILIH